VSRHTSSCGVLWINKFKFRPQSGVPPSYQESCPGLGKVDFCVTAAWQNHRHSRLLGLSDELLVAIMERLDEDDVLRLRHTSRTFMRLFSSSYHETFHDLHLGAHDDDARRLHLARVWAAPRTPIFTPYEGPRYCFLECFSCKSARKNNYISAEAQMARSMPFLYCSGCQKEHRAFYFSLRQRRESNKEDRICLGRERPLLLCSHVRLTWDSISRLTDRPPGENMVICNHKQHIGASDSRHVGKPAQASSVCPHDDRPKLKAWRSSTADLCLEISATIHVWLGSPSRRNNHRAKSMRLRHRMLKKFNKYFGRETCRMTRPPWALVWDPRNVWGYMAPFDPNLCSPPPGLAQLSR
jgi:F-box associated protein